LPNVSLICNANQSFDELREKIPQIAGGYQAAFLLETLEHVGERGRLYPSKMEFLRELFSLLNDTGAIIISVPKMVGIGFLAKHTLQTALRIPTEKISFRDFCSASFLKNTDAMEKNWDGKHLGFNHLKLTDALEKNFEVRKQLGTLSSIFYVVSRKK
ncbi:MAG TPA: hypothetical protein VGF52_03630, partial [Tepidisphaeraceae bacterium]